MFSTRSLTTDLVRACNIPACLSTIGLFDSRYVATNDGYLKLIERVWSEIENRNLVTEGSAISDSHRDRRLWLLDTQGFYDAESADIRSATGRLVPVKISSQRVWCSGTACDLEFFEPAFSLRLDKPVVPAGDTDRKATFSARLKKSLNKMSLLDKEILVRRILFLVAEGLVLAANISQSNEIQAALHAIIERISPFCVKNAAISTNVSYDFSPLDYEETADLLLNIAGEIWLVIVFCNNQEVGDMLKSLVGEYTVPKPLIIS